MRSAAQLAGPYDAHIWTGKRWRTVGVIDPRGVDSVLASSSAPGRVYATTQDRRLYRGEGASVRWRQSSTRIPGKLVAARGTRSEVIYAAKRALYESHDRGSSWRRLSCGLVISDVAIAGGNPRVIYVAANAPDSHTTRKIGGLYRTRDGGRTWKRFINFPKPNPDEPLIDVVAVDPHSPDNVFLGAYGGGIVQSTDGGRHWRFLPVGHPETGLDGPQVGRLAFGPGARPMLWAASSQGVFRGDSAGRTWSRTGLTASAFEVVPDPRNRQLVFALTTDTQLQVRMRTVDGGRHWLRMTGLPHQIEGLTVGKADGSVYAWGGRSIYCSRDHGVTWTRLPPLPRPSP
ncbi:MAG TPA: hypothetical protein VFL41_05410 [Gaiellaceae bacterium]|nr:hypothetical protein [Gaiellaceae bacterium]